MIYFGIILFIVIITYFVKNIKYVIPFLIVTYPIITIFYYIKIGPFSILDIIYGSFTVILLIGLIFINRKIKLGQNTIWLILFIILVSGHLFFTYGSLNSNVNVLFKIILPLSVYTITVSAYNYSEKDKVIKIIVYSFIIFCLVLLFQLISGIGLNYSKFSYAVGLYGDEGTLSRIGLIGVTIFVPLLIFNEKIIRRRILVILLIFSFIFLLVAVSRNAILASIIVLSYYILKYRKFKYLIFSFSAIILLFLNFAILENNIDNKIGKEMRYLNGANIDVRTLGSGRIGRWEDAIDRFENFDVTQTFFGDGKTIGPHGQIIDLLVRFGLLGLFLVVTFFYRVHREVLFIAKRTSADSTTTITIGLLIGNWVMFFGATPLYEFYFQMIIFAFLGLTQLKKRQYQ